MTNLILFKLDDPAFELFQTYDAENQILGVNTLAPFPYPQDTNIAIEAARGLRFTDFYTQPSCSPTRAALQTGRFGFDTGIGGIIDPGRFSESGYNEFDTLGRFPELHLPQALKLHPSDVPLTRKIGKGHLGQHHEERGRGEKYWTEHIGFDRFTGTIRLVGPASDPGLKHAGAVSNGGRQPGYWFYRWWDTDLVGLPYTVKHDFYATKQIEADAIDFIQNEATAEPFYLEVTFQATHAPKGSPDNLSASGLFPGLKDSDVNANTHQGAAVYPFADADNPWTSTLASYEAVDKTIGAVIAAMSPAQYADTVIVIMGDNGTPASLMRDGIADGVILDEPALSLATDSLMKGSVFRQGNRTPLIISGPTSVIGATQVGQTTDILCQVHDLNAFIEDMFGVHTLASAERVAREKVYRGVTFLPQTQLKTAEALWTKDTVYFEVFFPNGDPERVTLGKVGPGGIGHAFRRGVVHRYSGDGQLYAYATFMGGNPADIHADLTLDPGGTTDIGLTAATSAAKAALLSINPLGEPKNGAGTGTRVIPTGSINDHALRAGTIQ